MDIIKDQAGSWVKVKEESVLREELDFDELDMLEIEMALEDEFEIEVLDEDISRLVTVKDVIDYVEEKIG